MFSIYTSAFNVNKGNFQWREAIESFSRFVMDFGEVVVAVNPSDDNSFEDISEFAKKFKNVKVIPTAIPYDNPDMDGLIKNEALQHTTKQFKIGLDLDEYIPSSNRWLWVMFLREMGGSNKVDALMIPSVNLYGDENHVSEVNQKWYGHKENLYRGTLITARRDDGTHDVKKSDSCELVDVYGRLCRFEGVIDNDLPTEKKLELIKNNVTPYVVHLGYLDLNRRVELNRNFWKDQWEIENGAPVKIPLSLAELNKPTIKHNLNIFPIYG